MTLTTETFEADFFRAFFIDQILSTNLERTFVGTLDPQQNTLVSQAAPSLGLDGTVIRSDIYRLQVEPGSTVHIELAADGNFGGSLQQFGFTVFGDNGSTQPGVSFSALNLSVLERSDDQSGTLFRGSYDSGNHNSLYVLVSADADDHGTYSFSASETLEGLGDDSVFGGASDDVLQGYRGDDLIDGFDGQDTARYQQNDSVFTLKLGGEIQIEDRTGNEGTDTLARVEVLDFLNNDFELFRFDDVSSLTQAEFSSFTEMYIAYFNRAPDAAGLMFWANAFATGTSLETIAELFASSAEAQALYPEGTTNASFVETVFGNVLGRPSDPSGANFWISTLDSGSVTRDFFVLEILRGARSDAPDDATPSEVAQRQADVAYLDNKIDVGIYFSAILGMSDVDNGRDVMALFDGSADSIAAARAAADEDFVAASASDGTGEFLIQLVGVIDDPFAMG